MLKLRVLPKQPSRLRINSEKIQVLNIEPEFSRIRALRAVEGTAGAAHSVTTVLYEDPRKVVVDAGFKTTFTAKNNKQIYIYNDAKKAVSNADVIFSDKVISLNDKVNKKKKIQAFKNYKIDKKLMKFSNNAIFLHCLPRGNEVTDEIFLGNRSCVWQQASNRVHVQKSILLYCFGKLR